MCLILHRSTEPQIVTKDITCYKMIRQFDDIQFASIFFNHKWTCNELYSTDITVTNIDEHSPSSFKTYWNIDSLKILKQTAAQYKIISVCDEINMTNMLLFRKIIASNQFKTISTGFHSVVRLEDAIKTLPYDSLYTTKRIVECIIPKGSTYYTSGYEYASDQLIINKTIK